MFPLKFPVLYQAPKILSSCRYRLSCAKDGCRTKHSRGTRTACNPRILVIIDFLFSEKIAMPYDFYGPIVIALAVGTDIFRSEPEEQGLRHLPVVDDEPVIVQSEPYNILATRNDHFFDNFPDDRTHDVLTITRILHGVCGRNLAAGWRGYRVPGEGRDVHPGKGRGICAGNGRGRPPRERLNSVSAHQERIRMRVSS